MTWFHESFDRILSLCFINFLIPNDQPSFYSLLAFARWYELLKLYCKQLPTGTTSFSYTDLLFSHFWSDHNLDLTIHDFSIVLSHPPSSLVTSTFSWHTFLFFDDVCPYAPDTLKRSFHISKISPLLVVQIFLILTHYNANKAFPTPYLKSFNLNDTFEQYIILHWCHRYLFSPKLWTSDTIQIIIRS